MDYKYVVDLDERGTFQAHVEDVDGKTVYEIDSDEDNLDGGIRLAEDGWMSHNRDINGLTNFLQHIGVFGSIDTIEEIVNESKKAKKCKKKIDEEIEDKYVKQIADYIGFEGDLSQLKNGIEIEMEHNPTVGWSMIEFASIARDHLNEFPDYYTRLSDMEATAKAEGSDNLVNESDLQQPQFYKHFSFVIKMNCPTDKVDWFNGTGKEGGTYFDYEVERVYVGKETTGDDEDGEGFTYMELSGTFKIHIKSSPFDSAENRTLESLGSYLWEQHRDLLENTGGNEVDILECKVKSVKELTEAPIIEPESAKEDSKFEYYVKEYNSRLKKMANKYGELRGTLYIDPKIALIRHPKDSTLRIAHVSLYRDEVSLESGDTPDYILTYTLDARVGDLVSAKLVKVDPNNASRDKILKLQSFKEPNTPDSPEITKTSEKVTSFFSDVLIELNLDMDNNKNESLKNVITKSFDKKLK